MGYDLHTHGPSSECGERCLARVGGRRTQVGAQLSLLKERTAGFFVVKAIDGLPRTNGAHLIMAQRTASFLYRPLNRQYFYEMLPDAATAQGVLLESARWNAAGVSEGHVDHVQIVVEAFESWYTAPRGNIQMPTGGDRSIGLHSVLVTGFADSGATIHFINSWGPQWGRRGYGSMSFEYFERHFFDAVMTRRARWGITSWKFAEAANLSTPRDARYRFLVENPRYRNRIRVCRGDNWQTCAFDTFSVVTGKSAAGIEIANGFGLKMGWAFVRYLDDGVLEIPELFVWPIFRRMRIGRMLEEFAVEYARLWGCSDICLMMNEADAVTGPPRAAARLFAQARGYHWKWRNDVAPRRAGTAYKTVERR
jgi:GNAT superfamily N-acetyltransferase